MGGHSIPVRISVHGASDLLVAGLASLLRPYQDRVTVVEWSQVEGRGHVDVVLLEMPASEATYLEIITLTGAKVVPFAWRLDPDEIELAIAAGAAGYLWQGLSAESLVQALTEIGLGSGLSRPGAAHVRQRWMADFGLSRREAQILGLVARGMSNQEIGQLLYVSINSVKTYIRSAYRKIGVATRAQAVAWAMSNGLDPAALAAESSTQPVGVLG